MPTVLDPHTPNAYDEDALPWARCTVCAREVVTWCELGHGGELVQRCLDCDAPIEPSQPSGHWTTTELVERGYLVEGYRDPHASGGCRGGACGGSSCGHD